MVPEATPRSYHGLPVLQPPVWRDEVAVYLFVGGMGGASLAVAAAARLRGTDPLARRALLLGAGCLMVSPALLVKDLARPARFLNMLRVLRPTSPMSVGSWLLSACGSSAAAAAASELTGRARGFGRVAEVVAGGLGLGVATYTAVLVSDTAVPLWHESGRDLPFVFAGSAAASAGGALTALSPRRQAAPARRLAVAGAVLELAASRLMERRLGVLGRPLREGEAGRWHRAAEGLTAAGALGVLGGMRWRALGAAGGLALMAGSFCTRFAVFRAGAASAADPMAVIAPQRARLGRRPAPSAVRRERPVTGL